MQQEFHAGSTLDRHFAQSLRIPRASVNQTVLTTIPEFKLPQPLNNPISSEQSQFYAQRPFFSRGSMACPTPPMRAEPESSPRRKLHIGPEPDQHFTQSLADQANLAFTNRPEYYTFCRILDLPHLQWEAHGLAENNLVAFRSDGTPILSYHIPISESEHQTAQPFLYQNKKYSFHVHCALRYYEPLLEDKYLTVLEVSPREAEHVLHSAGIADTQELYVLLHSDRYGWVIGDRFATTNDLPTRYQRTRQRVTL